MPETIGQRLKQAREEKRLTLEKAAEATRVRLPYLQALENDDYSVMISAAQGRGFLRLYTDYLGLNLDAVVNEVKAANVTAQAPAPAPVAEAALEPIAHAEPAASAPDPKPARPGFWSRLLRRSAPPAAPQAEPQPVPEPIAASESQAEPAASLTIEETLPTATALEAEPVKPAKRTRRTASDTEPQKKPRAAASKKKLLTT